MSAGVHRYRGDTQYPAVFNSEDMISDIASLRTMEEYLERRRPPNADHRCLLTVTINKFEYYGEYRYCSEAVEQCQRDFSTACTRQRRIN